MSAKSKPSTWRQAAGSKVCDTGEVAVLTGITIWGRPGTAGAAQVRPGPWPYLGGGGGERTRPLGGRARRPEGRSAQPLSVPEVLSVLACDELGLTAFVAACDVPVLVEPVPVPVLVEPVLLVEPEVVEPASEP